MTDTSEATASAGETPGTPRRAVSAIAVVVAVIGAVAGLVTCVAAGILADIYRPHADGVELWLLPGVVRRADRWTDIHAVAVLTLVAASFVTAAFVWAKALDATSWRRRHVAAGISAAGAAVGAWYTTALVRWDQLAIEAVTIGGDIDGYWTAAFGDGVVFVLVDGAEVSQGAYALALSVHLVAPLVAAVLLGHLVLTHVRGARRRDVAS